MNPVLKKVALYVRDLMQYDEQLIKIGRANAEQESSGTNYITIDAISQARRYSGGSLFDGTAESETLYSRYKQNVTISFYGDGAYDNMDDFLMLQRSQLSNDLQFQYDITVFPSDSFLDIKQILGSTYANRLDVSVNIAYNKQKIINTLRIDELQSEFLFDN